MLLERFKKKMEEDELLIYKICVLAGTSAAFLLGLIISDQADKYEVTFIKEANDDNSTIRNSVGE